MYYLASINGEVQEWLNWAVSKTAVPSNRYRGFESLPLRQEKTAHPCGGLFASCEASDSVLRFDYCQIFDLCSI